MVKLKCYHPVQLIPQDHRVNQERFRENSWSELSKEETTIQKFTPTSSNQTIDLPTPFTSQCYNVITSIAEDISSDSFKNDLFSVGYPTVGDSSKITIVIR